MNLNKIIDDTLKEKNGKWSRKSLSMFVCMVMSVVVGNYIVFSHLFIDRPIASGADTVFLGFLGGALGTAYLTVKDKTENKEYHNKETIG